MKEEFNETQKWVATKLKRGFVDAKLGVDAPNQVSDGGRNGGMVDTRDLKSLGR